MGAIYLLAWTLAAVAVLGWPVALIISLRNAARLKRIEAQLKVNGNA